MKKQVDSRSFSKINRQLKSALKLKLFVLFAKTITVTDNSGDNNWAVVRSVKGIYVIAPNGNSYRMKLKSVLLLANALALNGDFEGANWWVFRSHNGLYVIHPNGKYYKINISTEGELQLYRGRNRIYSGKRFHYRKGSMYAICMLQTASSSLSLTALTHWRVNSLRFPTRINSKGVLLPRPIIYGSRSFCRSSGNGCDISGIHLGG